LAGILKGEEMKNKIMEDYITACEYPGVIDAVNIEKELSNYLNSLKVTRKVVQLKRGWDVFDYPEIERNTRTILQKIDAIAARAARDAIAARDARAKKILNKFSRFVTSNYWFYAWELSWIATTYIGDNKIIWAKYLYNAFCSGCWFLYWTEDTLYWFAKPECKSYIKKGRKILHDNKNPAIKSDWMDLYFLNGVLIPEQYMIAPLCVKDIQKEGDLEIQRELIELFGIDKYLLEIDAQVVDMDIRGIEGGGARCLMRTKNGQQWLVCTDGSTERVYHLSAPSEARTCREAHEALCGFNEKLIQMEG